MSKVPLFLDGIDRWGWLCPRTRSVHPWSSTETWSRDRAPSSTGRGRDRRSETVHTQGGNCRGGRRESLVESRRSPNVLGSYTRRVRSQEAGPDNSLGRSQTTRG